MKAHLKRVHKNRKDLVECSICQKNISRRNFDRHMATHTDAVAARCDICDKDFIRTGDYRAHCGEYAYERACIENGNIEFSAWPATISFQNLHFQNTAAR